VTEHTDKETESHEKPSLTLPPWRVLGLKLAKFFNTPLGLFVLSSVLLAGVSRVYTDLQSRSEQQRALRVSLAPLVAEMKYRVVTAGYLSRDIEGVQKVTERDSCVFLWRMVVGDKEYRPAVPEMREVHWLGLLSRAQTLTGIDTTQGEKALIKLEMDLDGGRCEHPMKPSDQIAVLQQIADQLAAAYARTAT